MKTSTTHIVIFIILVLILYGQWASRVGKILERMSTRYSETATDESQIRRHENESMLNEHVILLNDSSRHLYKVRIFPLDSFSYSIQNGFKGKALTIEVTGSADQLTKIGNYERSFINQRTDNVKSSSGKTRKVEKSGFKKVKKSSDSWIWGAGFFILVLLARWWWKYGSRNRLASIFSARGL